MEKKACLTPSALRASAKGCARAVELPTTMSATVPPMALAAAGTRFSASPRPKTMRPAEANSNGANGSNAAAAAHAAMALRREARTRRGAAGARARATAWRAANALCGTGRAPGSAARCIAARRRNAGTLLQRAGDSYAAMAELEEHELLERALERPVGGAAGGEEEAERKARKESRKDKKRRDRSRSRSRSRSRERSRDGDRTRSRKHDRDRSRRARRRCVSLGPMCARCRRAAGAATRAPWPWHAAQACPRRRAARHARRRRRAAALRVRFPSQP
jgi:hypothetical protein